MISVGFNHAEYVFKDHRDLEIFMGERGFHKDNMDWYEETPKPYIESIADLEAVIDNQIRALKQATSDGNYLKGEQVCADLITTLQAMQRLYVD